MAGAVAAFAAACAPDPIVDTDVAAVADVPRLEAGSYLPTLAGLSENTCGNAATVFTVGPLSVSWLDDSTFEVSAPGKAWDPLVGGSTTGICAVDAHNQPSCTGQDLLFQPNYPNAMLSFTYGLEVAPASTTAFRASESLHMTSCEGVNCDALMHTFFGDAIRLPCILTLETDFAIEVPEPEPDIVNVALWLTTEGGEGIPGAKVTLGERAATTDETGLASFDVDPHTPVDLVGTLDGYATVHVVGLAGTYGVKWARPFWSWTELDRLTDAFGRTVDPTKGMMLIKPVRTDGTNFFPLAGSTVELDRPYDLALVAQGSSAVFYTEGNTSLEGEGPEMVFLNVDPGKVYVDFTPPEGYECELSDGGPPPSELEFDVEAGVVTSLTYLCVPA